MYLWLEDALESLPEELVPCMGVALLLLCPYIFREQLAVQASHEMVRIALYGIRCTSLFYSCLNRSGIWIHRDTAATLVRMCQGMTDPFTNFILLFCWSAWLGELLAYCTCTIWHSARKLMVNWLLGLGRCESVCFRSGLSCTCNRR